MPKIVTAGPKSKNPGRKFLVYDPSIPGDLPAHWVKPYEKQKEMHKAATAETDRFIAMIMAEAKKEGNTEALTVMLNFDKISVTLDDGNGRKSKVPQVKPDAVDWTKVSSALKA